MARLAEWAVVHENFPELLGAIEVTRGLGEGTSQSRWLVRAEQRQRSITLPRPARVAGWFETVCRLELR